ncbi:MAG: XRE family transcriptional regulator [Epsilonproteobacteria bacterium]|nr:XRE family transcriptional regulator [Campylobacterota bacterium]
MKTLYFDFTDEEIANFYRLIGKNVKRLRQEKGLTQMELGLALGHTGVGTISVAEVYHNKKHFNLEHLYKIAKILDCDISEFFKD